MRNLAWILIAIPCALVVYSYLLYPILLKVASLFTATPEAAREPAQWPDITITIPCYNEERSIGATIDSILALDYPADRRRILVVSDASSDRTDEIVRSYADRGVSLVRLTERRGKTGAENAAGPHLQGDIVISTDATIRILPGALRALVAVFQDPTIGVASGRDISVGDLRSVENRGEAGYVGYEMWVRSLETRVGTIVGASGCFFASRRPLYDLAFPEALSRDFASCLIARERGYRSVSVDAACALVPRATSLRAEYRRKSRTMARGLGTLHYKRHLMNPIRYGMFGPMLFSHKLCRWLIPLTLPLLGLGILLLVPASPWVALWAVLGAASLGAIALLAWRWPDGRRMPFVLSAPGYLIWSNLAGMVAWIRFIQGRYQPVWEPTRRPDIGPVA